MGWVVVAIIVSVVMYLVCGSITLDAEKNDQVGPFYFFGVLSVLWFFTSIGVSVMFVLAIVKNLLTMLFGG